MDNRSAAFAELTKRAGNDPQKLSALEELRRRSGIEPVQPLKTSADLRAMAGDEYSAAPASSGEAMLLGVGRGATDLWRGGKQAFLSIFGDEGEAEEYTRMITDEARRYDNDMSEHPVSSTIGELIGAAASTGPIPGGVAGSLGRRAAIAGLQGAALGGLQAVDEDQLDDQLGARLGNAATGAAIGAGASTAFSAAGKAINAASKNPASLLNKTGRAGRRATERGDITAQEAQALSNEMGVRVLHADVDGRMVTKAIDRAMEMVPIFGTQGARRAQLKEAQDALVKIKGSFEDMLGGKTASKAIKSGVLREVTARKAKSDTLYNVVERIMDDEHVPTPELNGVVRQLMKKEKAKGRAKDPRLMGFYKKYAIDNGWNFGTARSIRSDMKTAIRGLLKDDVIGDTDVMRLQRMVEGLENDMAEATAHIPGARQAFEKANRYYRDKVVPLKDKIVAKTLDEDRIDGVVNQFISRTDSDAARKLYSVADDEAKKGIRTALMQRAVELTPGSEEVVTPGEFVKRVRHYNKLFGLTFTESEKRTLQGAKKLMNAVRRSGAAGAIEPTGYGAARLAGLAGAVTAGAKTGVSDPITSLSVGAVMRAAFATDWGRRLMASAGRPNIKQKELQSLFDSIEQLAQRGATMEATDQDEL